MVEHQLHESIPDRLGRGGGGMRVSSQAKYAVTAEDIEKRRDAAAKKLKGFLGELWYA
jgi:hypothetical protein